MARLSLSTASYAAAQAALGSRDSKRIGHNTTVHRLYGSTGYAVRYHSTDILTMRDDGSVELSTGGWDTITTKTRLNALLPGPYSIHGHRIGRDTSLYLWVRGYPMTPFVDGLTIHPADGSVSFQGETILTAADIAAMIDAAEDRRAMLDARREVTRKAQHAARPGAPSASFRHRWDCPDCRTLEAAEREARSAILHAEHDRNEHSAVRPVYDWRKNADGSNDYTAGSWHDTGRSETYSTCPWDCPDRTR